MATQNLSALLRDLGPYPEDHPQTLKELLDADPEQLSHPLAWALRSQALEVMRSTKEHYINGPKDAFRLLKNGYVLHPWTGKWTSYALSENRQVVKVPHPKGGTRSLRVATPIIPKPDDLPKIPRDQGKSDRKPAWLILYGGTPEVLSIKGVAKGLAKLQRMMPIADVMFYANDTESGKPPTLWSLAAGCGVCDNGSAGGVRVEFPDAEALQEARRTA